MKHLFIILASVFALTACNVPGAGNDVPNPPDTTVKPDPDPDPDPDPKPTHYLKDLTAAQFIETIGDFYVPEKDFVYLHDKPAIIDFWGIWCAPCLELEKTLARISVEYYGRIDIFKVDLGSNFEFRVPFSIDYIPRMHFHPMPVTPADTMFKVFGDQEYNKLCVTIETRLLR